MRYYYQNLWSSTPELCIQRDKEDKGVSCFRRKRGKLCFSQGQRKVRGYSGYIGNDQERCFRSPICQGRRPKRHHFGKYSVPTIRLAEGCVCIVGRGVLSVVPKIPIPKEDKQSSVRRTLRRPSG